MSIRLVHFDGTVNWIDLRCSSKVMLAYAFQIGIYHERHAFLSLAANSRKFLSQGFNSIQVGSLQCTLLYCISVFIDALYRASPASFTRRSLLIDVVLHDGVSDFVQTLLHIYQLILVVVRD